MEGACCPPITRVYRDVPTTLQDLLPFLPELNVLDLLGQHDWRLKQFFRDPRLRAMFTFQASTCAVRAASHVLCVLCMFYPCGAITLLFCLTNLL